MARSSFNEPMPGVRQRLKREPVPVWITVALIAIVAIFPVFMIDLNAARTELITPLPPGTMRGSLIAGAMTGLIGACLTGATVRPLVVGPVEARRYGLWRGRIGVFVMTALWAVPGYTAMADHFAWRATELAIFHGSSVPIVPARYREQDYRFDDKGSPRYYVEIDPYHTGDPARVAMPGVDFRRLRSADRQDLAYGFCAKVMEQRVGTAVRIWKPHIDDGSPSQLVWCPDRVPGDPANWVNS